MNSEQEQPPDIAATDNTIVDDEQQSAEQQSMPDMEENFSLYTAISDPRSDEPIQITDVIEKLSKSEPLEERESICYIGSGNFAVVHAGDGGDVRD